MKTGLTNRQKTTAIYFDEFGDLIEVQPHKTDLKKRLSKFAVMYPDHCRQPDDDEQGGLTFEIEKGRLSFRLTAPYSTERRKASSERAKKYGISAKYAQKIVCISNIVKTLDRRKIIESFWVYSRQ